MEREILNLLKQNLGIKGSARDGYFLSLIRANLGELSRKGITLTDSVDDLALVSDYSAWFYRKRETGEPLPENLRLRIKNRVVEKRGEANV